MVCGCGRRGAGVDRGHRSSCCPYRGLEAVASDPDDNRVLECAVAAGSAFIVTGDNDLLRLREFRQVPILRLSDFLALIDRDNGLAP